MEHNEVVIISDGVPVDLLDLLDAGNTEKFQRILSGVEAGVGQSISPVLIVGVALLIMLHNRDVENVITTMIAAYKMRDIDHDKVFGE